MEKSSLTKNGAWNVLARLVPLAITFFITPLLVARLGTAHYGLYMLIMSVSGLMGLMSLGLGDATLRFVAHYHGRNHLEGINRVVGATLFVYLSTGLVTVLVVTLAAPRLIALFSIAAGEGALAVQLLRLTSISFFFSLYGGALAAIPQALQRYHIGTKIVIGTALLQSACTVLLLLSGHGVVALTLLGVCTNCLILCLNAAAAKRLLPGVSLLPSARREGLREVFSYGIFSFLSQIFGISFSYSDRLLTGVFVSSSSVGFLTIPQDLAFRALSLVGQGGAVLFPRFSVIDDPSERSSLYLQATWTMLFLSILIFVPLTIFIEDFIGLWINPGFARNCSRVGQLIAFSSLIRGAFVPYESLFKGINKPQYVTMLSFCVGITNLTLNLILIPRYGLAGAGFAFCVTAIWGILTLLVTWKRILNRPSYLPLARTVLAPVLLALTCMGGGFLLRSLCPPSSWLLLFVEGGGVLAGTAALLLWFELRAGREQNCAEVVIRRLKAGLGVKIKVQTT